MTLWLIVGLIVWTLCVLFMLAIVKGGHRIRGNGYEQKLYSRKMVNTQNIEDSMATRTRRNQHLPILHRP